MNDANILMPDIKLRFNIDYPSLEECYLFGYECALAGVDEEDNPHPYGKKEHEYWAEGWWAGFYEEEPLFSPLAKKADLSSAANEKEYQSPYNHYLYTLLKIGSVIAATAIVGYQVFDLVA